MTKKTISLHEKRRITFPELGALYGVLGLIDGGLLADDKTYTKLQGKVPEDVTRVLRRVAAKDIIWMVSDEARRVAMDIEGAGKEAR